MILRWTANRKALLSSLGWLCGSGLQSDKRWIHLNHSEHGFEAGPYVTYDRLDTMSMKEKPRRCHAIIRFGPMGCA